MNGRAGGKWKTVTIWIVLVVVFVLLFTMQSGPKPPQRTNFEQFRKAVAAGTVEEVWADGNQIVYQLNDSPQRAETTGLISRDFERTLQERTAFHRTPPPVESRSDGWFLYVIVFLGIVVLVVFVLLRARAKQGGFFWGEIMNLRKSRAVLVDGEKKVTFADVGGCEEAKLALGDVVDFLKCPQRWIDAGARLPRGVLLDGPPGCGKTLLARAVAGETNTRFYSVSASEFVELFVGVGAARVRDMFEAAVKNAPAIIFIDELDAVGRRRGTGVGGGHDEREQTLNQLLVNLDGFKANDRVVVLAATNRAEILDPALLRPDASTAGSACRSFLPRAAWRCSRSTPATSRWRREFRSRSGPTVPWGSRGPTWKAWPTRRRCWPCGGCATTRRRRSPFPARTSSRRSIRCGRRPASSTNWTKCSWRPTRRWPGPAGKPWSA